MTVSKKNARPKRYEKIISMKYNPMTDRNEWKIMNVDGVTEGHEVPTFIELCYLCGQDWVNTNEKKDNPLCKKCCVYCSKECHEIGECRLK